MCVCVGYDSMLIIAEFDLRQVDLKFKTGLHHRRTLIKNEKVQGIQISGVEGYILQKQQTERRESTWECTKCLQALQREGPGVNELALHIRLGVTGR